MNRLARILIVVGSLSLVAATITSALGAHALTRVLTPEKLKSWEWATELHFYRAEYVGEIRRIFNTHRVAWQMTDCWR